MMLSLNGRPSHLDGFLFFLGEKLGKTVTEIEEMPASEYVAWQAFYKVKAALDQGGG